MKKAIGGYFGIELGKMQSFFHPNGILVNSGRNAFEYILRSFDKKPQRVWLPYYTCEVMLQPLIRLNISYSFYEINERLEVSQWPNLKEGDYIVINNYYGLKDEYIRNLARDKSKLNHIIVDNSQAWYAHKDDIKSAFYSPRKFFGLPDGGIACSDFNKTIQLDKSVSFDRCAHLLKRIDLDPLAGFNDYHKNEEALDAAPMKEMSNLTRILLSNIDFESSKIKRRENYKILSLCLDMSNLLDMKVFESYSCPMVYPYLCDDSSLRSKLIENMIYVPKYWPNVLKWTNNKSFEYYLTEHLIPLPIDQRYGEKEMETIIKIIKKEKNESYNSRRQRNCHSRCRPNV